MWLMIVLSRSFLVVITINVGFIVRQLTNAARGTANVWHFYNVKLGSETKLFFI